MKTSVEVFRRVLCTLQHAARFPSCNLAAICRRDGTVLAEVEAVIKEVAGSIANWDEEYLAKAAGELGIELPAFSPVRLARSAPVTSSGDAPSPAPTAAPKKWAAPVASAELPGYLDGKAIKPRYAAVIRLLLSEARMNPRTACDTLGVSRESWAYFERTRFGSVGLDRIKLRTRFSDTPPAAGLPANTAPTVLARRAAPPPPASPPQRQEVRQPAQASLELLEQVNALLAGYRLEITAARLVPREATA